MRTLSSLLLALLLLVMTPQARQAFGAIAGARITSGTMDIQGNETHIKAVGRKDGVWMEITCLWRSGLPVWILCKQVAQKT